MQLEEHFTDIDLWLGQGWMQLQFYIHRNASLTKLQLHQEEMFQNHMYLHFMTKQICTQTQQQFKFDYMSSKEIKFTHSL